MDDFDGKKKGTGAGAVGGAAAGGVAGGAAAGAAAGGMTGPAGAAVGAAVGAGIGALSGRGAAAAQESHSGTSMHTVIGAFDDRNLAERAVDRLTQSGFDRQDVHVEQSGSAVQPEPEERKAGFFERLFGMDDEASSGRAATYGEAVRRGSSIVIVDARDETEADRAATLLHELGAVDVDERARQWRSQGWTGDGSPAREGDREGVLDVVQEELQVGKRRMDRGGVRVVQRVSQKPVREMVQLREERAVVERRPVDREVSSGDLGSFKEGTLEVRESVEEPVVAKKARVVEEVRVGKEVREREQAIEDTVRRKDVEVERLGGERSTRECAVASDDRDVPSTNRDPDVEGPDGKRRS